MQSADAVVEVLRARGRRGLPCERLYRQLFNTELFLMAWGRIYANDGAMTSGINGETADGMSLAKIGRIIDALRCERYRFQPVKRVYIPKKNGRKSSYSASVKGIKSLPCSIMRYPGLSPFRVLYDTAHFMRLRFAGSRSRPDLDVRGLTQAE